MLELSAQALMRRDLGDMETLRMDGTKGDTMFLNPLASASRLMNVTSVSQPVRRSWFIAV